MVTAQVSFAQTTFKLVVNDACNQAKWLRNAAGAMWLFLLLRTLFFPPAGCAYSGLFLRYQSG
jgi:hypothetical protein